MAASVWHAESVTGFDLYRTAGTHQSNEISGGGLFSVSQIANQLGITARTIRFYEDKGLIAPCRAGTTRVYTVRDRARLMLILRGKRLGFSLREIKEYLDLYDIDLHHVVQVRKLLTAVRKRITKLQEQQVALEQSLEELVKIERQAEERLMQEPPNKPEA